MEGGRGGGGAEGRAGLPWDPSDTRMQPFVVSVTLCFQIDIAFSLHFACTVGSRTGQCAQRK